MTTPSPSSKTSQIRAVTSRSCYTASAPAAPWPKPPSPWALCQLFGILTFPKSNELRAIAADLPADRLLVETDAPYLAPVPFRGRRNEPAHVAHTARVLGDVRGLPPTEIAALTHLELPKVVQ